MKRHILAAVLALLPAYLNAYTASAALSYSNQTNITIQGKSFSTGVSGAAIYLTNCNNVKIINCSFSLNSGIIGVRLAGCSNVEISENYMENFNSGIYATNCTGGIDIHCNVFYAIAGAKPRGQMVQFNGCAGTGNRVNFNTLDTPVGSGGAEDLINFYNSSGTASDPIQCNGNKLRGGGPSTSGGGIMLGDNGSHDLVCDGNILVDPGQYGISSPSGYNVVIKNNRVYSSQHAWSNVGIYVGVQSEIDAGFTCNGPAIQVLNNQVNWTNKNGIKNGWYPCPCCPGVVQSGNNFNAGITSSILPAALTLDPAACGAGQATATPTRTPPPQATKTKTPPITKTNTPLPVKTFTMTGTRTNTPVQTATFTAAATKTSTPVVTNTQAATATKTLTPMQTATFTSTETKTSTPVVTSIRTSTATGTLTPVQTATFTATVTKTSTPVVTDTHTSTATKTISATPSLTLTSTNTFTAANTVTMTRTPAETQTETNAPTGTFTAEKSATPSMTRSDTAVMTLTNTPAYTITGTASNTPAKTATGTSTPAISPVFTATSTGTASGSATAITPPISTFTKTPTPSPVLSATATATASPDTGTGLAFSNEGITIFPNPAKGSAGVNVSFCLSGMADNAEIKVYTTSGRLIRKINYDGPFYAGRSTVRIESPVIGPLANGSYTCVIRLQGQGREISRREVLILLK